MSINVNSKPKTKKPDIKPFGQKVRHISDCAVHNMPAYPNKSCDCGAEERK